MSGEGATLAEIMLMRLEEYRRDDACRDADQLDQSVRDWEARHPAPPQGDHDE
jgi:hypothetical protein